MSTPRPIRALVVGAGPAAVALHLPVLAQLSREGQLVLQEVCDLDRGRAQAAAERFGFRAWSGDAATALARDDVDAVYVLASAQTHHEVGRAALVSGKHLFVEKPVAPSYAAARELAALAAARGLISAGGHNRRFLRAFEQVRGQRGAGGWRFLEAVFHKPDFGHAAPFGARTWLTANGIHALDALLYLMGGPPAHLSAQVQGTSVFAALLRWSEGGQGVLLCNNEAGGRREEYVLHRAGETWRITEDVVSLERDGGVTRTPVRSLGDGVRAEHEAFLEAITTGIPPRHALSALAPALYIAELIEAGHDGPVQLPQEQALALAPRRAAPAVLVLNPAGVLAPLSQQLPQAQLLSVADLERSPQRAASVEAVVLGRGPEQAPALLADLPNLRVVGVVGLSLRAQLPAALLQRPLVFVNASEAYADSVAEFALALAALARRRAFQSHELMRRGGWGIAPARGPAALRAAARRLRPLLRRLRLESPLTQLWRRRSQGATTGGAAHDLRGCRVGLIGWGSNARALAQRLQAAGARVQAFSAHAPAQEIAAAGVTPASLAEVLACEIVSLHRGLTPQTRHALGAAELAQLRPGAVLINVARGALIEPAALLARLRRGDVLACLDTFEEEPLPGAHPLRRLSNVFLTSHLAGGTPEMQARAAEEVVTKVARALEGSATGVAPARLPTMT